MSQELNIILPVKNPAYIKDDGGIDALKIFDQCKKADVFNTACGSQFSGCSINEDNEYGGRDGATRGVRILLHEEVSLNDSGRMALLGAVRKVAVALGNRSTDLRLTNSKTKLLLIAYQ